MTGRHVFWGVAFLFFPVVVLAFMAGALVERSGWFLGGPGLSPAGMRKTFEPFWQAWYLVDKYYVDRAAVKPKPMAEGAIEGMLASLGDTGHTTYLTPEELKHLESGLEGHFEGIGARMTMRKGRPTVVQAMPNSPAEKAGLKSGDVLVDVNGKDVTAMPLDRIVELVRGPAGTDVHLRVLRKEAAHLLDFTIARGRVEIEDVSWHMLPGTSVAHIAIQEFGSEADAQLRKAIRQAKAQGARGFLLDVRGNPGGLKDQAVAVTSEFLKEGNVFLEKDAQGNQTAVPVEPGGVAPDIPACVLIDEGTASSAEIFAGALQDHGRAKLVGTHTFGTGTVLKPFLLSDGSAVLLAVLEWLTPNGRLIWHHGIKPDVEVALSNGAPILLPYEETNMDAAALKGTQDKQLLTALHLLQSEIDSRSARGD